MNAKALAALGLAVLAATFAATLTLGSPASSHSTAGRTRAKALSSAAVQVRGFAQKGAYALSRPANAPRSTSTPVEQAAADPEQAWRGFLGGYLAWEYGHGERLADLTPHLRRWLLASPPQVPASVKALHPQVAEIQLQPAPSGVIEVLAVIEDPAERYTLLGSLQRGAAGWQVVRLQPWG